MPDAISVDDLYLLGWIEEPSISPDGRWVAYVRVDIDRAANCYRRTIWLCPSQGGQALRLTAGPKSDSSPRWSPDGRWIAFVSDRAGAKPQLYVIRRDGGEARAITALAQGVSAPAWCPQGRQIAFLASVDLNNDQRPAAVQTPDEAWAQEQEKARRARADAQNSDPLVINRMPYRSGVAYFDQRRLQLFVVDVPETDEAALSACRRLTNDDVHYSAPAWMPDGRALLSTATRDPEADSLFAYYDVLRIPIPEHGFASPERVTGHEYSCFDPQASPDGRWIAFKHRPDDQPLAAGMRLAIIVVREQGAGLEEPGKGAIEEHWRDLTVEADLNVEQFRWQADSQVLLFTAASWGEQAIYAIRLGAEAASGQNRIEPVFGANGRIISDIDCAQDGTLVYVAGSATNPCEMFVRPANGVEHQLSQLHTTFLQSRAVLPIEELRYHAPDGAEIQGWVLYPPGFGQQPAQSFPLAVHIHGGPHLMWGPGVRSMWHELQVNAAQGYVTFFCNPRGSDGYGMRWRDGVHANWGAAAQDILAGVDVLLNRHADHIDMRRIGVTGGSYGGYMTAWLIGHSSRFACAVAARGVYDLVAFHGTSDAHELIEFEFDGYPWEVHDLLWQQSPLAYAQQIETPLLILHSEQDYRVPISQAEQLFSVLRRRKIPVEMVRYPREGHELTRSGEPLHRADHMRRTLEWFGRYCKW